VAAVVDALVIDDRPLHTAFGTASRKRFSTPWRGARRVTMAEVIRDEYETGIEIAPVPMFVQSGDDRYNNVDKMVLKEADVLPHGLINNLETRLGRNGELLKEFVTWVRESHPHPSHPIRLRSRSCTTTSTGPSGRRSTAISKEWRTT
jgi:methylaspartate ammonia-lyase